MHPRSKRVEDPGHPDFHLSIPLSALVPVRVHHCLGHAFPFVVAGARADGVDIAPVALRLGVDLGREGGREGGRSEINAQKSRGDGERKPSGPAIHSENMCSWKTDGAKKGGREGGREGRPKHVPAGLHTPHSSMSRASAPAPAWPSPTYSTSPSC